MTDERSWSPPRPDRTAAVWEPPRASSSRSPGDGTGPRADTDLDIDIDGLAEPSATRPADGPMVRVRGRAAGLWRRSSRPRRLVVVTGALVATTALVAGAGLLAEPRYGTASPLDGITAADVRHDPVSGSWTLTPDDIGVPDDRNACLSWTQETAVSPADLDGDVLVSASGDGSSLSTGCSFDGGFGSLSSGSTGVAQTVSRLARIDPETGTVRWWADLGRELGAGNGFVQTWPADDGSGTALVSTLGFGDGGFSAGYGRLDLTTGGLSDVTTSPAGRARLTDASASFALVSSDPEFSFDDATVYYDAEPGTGRFELYRTDDLTTPVWTGPTSGRQDEVLLDDGLLVLADGAVTKVDGTTGETRPWGPQLATATTIAVEDDLVLIGLDPAVPTSSGDTDSTVVALSLDGRERWRHGYRQDRGVQATDDCIVFSTTPGVVCVDRATGAERWTTPPRDERHGLARVTTDPAGDRGAVLFAQTFETGTAGGDGGGADDRQTRLLDPRTGRELARTALPTASTIDLVTRTTGFASSAVQGGRTSTVTAFDLADGRRLWQLTDDTAQFGFWGGAIVVNHPDGSVDRLVDPVRVAG